jgi:hypothetical protein
VFQGATKHRPKTKAAVLGERTFWAVHSS